MLPINPRRARRFTGVLVVSVLSALSQPAAGAGEILLQNDSLENLEDAVPQLGFAAGERAAVWLSGECAVANVVAVQVLWLSSTKDEPLSDATLRIYEEGDFPEPGDELDGFLTQLADGGFNEISVDPPVEVGATFVVALEFEENPPPSVVRDNDGTITGDRNAVYAEGLGGWIDAEKLGILGDFVIRALIECPIFSDGFESGDTSAWSATTP